MSHLLVHHGLFSKESSLMSHLLIHHCFFFAKDPPYVLLVRTLCFFFIIWNLYFFRLGGAIVVQNPPIRANHYSRLLYNPLCSVIHSDSQLQIPPDLWNVSTPHPITLNNVSVNITVLFCLYNFQASITFSSNHAVIAAAVFMNNLDFWSWVRLGPPFFNTSSVFRWDFVDFP